MPLINDNVNLLNTKQANQVHKIGDYLYEYILEEDSYFDKFFGNFLNGKVGKMFGCSAVQNGRYRGRNYDWFYGHNDICVVHAIKTKKRRHASVGISDFSFIALDENGKYDISKLNYSLIPLTTVDGINDAGVCIQVNVLPYGENFTDENPNFYKDKDNTNSLKGFTLVRYILDFADSVDHAVELIKQRDIDPTFNSQKEFHWMISGPTSKTNPQIKTVVIEIFPNKNGNDVKVIDKFVDDKPIMTNFNLSNFDQKYNSVSDKRLLIGLGFGYERWKVLNENFKQSNSIMGMFDLMRKAWDSLTYDLFGHDFWYSEHGGSGLKEYYQDQNLLKKLVDEKMGEGSYDAQMAKYGEIYYCASLYGPEGDVKGDITKTGVIAPLVEAFDKLHQTNDMNNTLWITVHTSVYDLVEKTLTLSVRESRNLSVFTINSK